MKTTKDLIDNLVDRLFSVKAVKEVSALLEELSHNKSFKLHAHAIVDDDSLSAAQKRRQLTYNLKILDNPVLMDFFEDVIGQDQFWLFTVGKIDYFDKFVQQFQMATEELEMVYLVTAVELTPSQLKIIAIDLSKTLKYRVIIKHEVNSSIIGGAQVRIENMVFDYSLRTKFAQFQQNWIATLEKTNKLIDRNQA